jgi:hypothetical protein
LYYYLEVDEPLLIVWSLEVVGVTTFIVFVRSSNAVSKVLEGISLVITDLE